LIVHQMGSVLSVGDAVTNHIFEIDRRLRQWGVSTRVYGADVSNSPGTRAERDSAFGERLESREDLLVYHYSAYCDNYRLFQRARCRKVLIYHNITPAEFYRPYDARYESLCARGRAVLSELADCDLALGVSDYNRRELVAAGFPPERTGLLPLFLGENDFESTERDADVFKRLQRDRRTTLLFVGKVAPNKAFEDLIKIFAAYHRHVNPQSQLVLAGARFLPLYDRVLDGLVKRLRLQGVVIFPDRLPLSGLRSCYEAADLFLCASQHEGFCAPLLEAMYFGVPILARATAAVPDTLDGAGIQYTALDYAQLSELIQTVVTDTTLRGRIVDGQRKRLRAFAPERVEAQLAGALARVGAEIPAGGLVR
jgi:L-malate glycosyltransferase